VFCANLLPLSLGNPVEISEQTLAILTNACFVIDALGPDIRREFISFFSTNQLGAYLREFKDGAEQSQLANVDKRYLWLRQYLKSYDQVFSKVFPPGWRLNEMITEEFCFQTREKLVEIMEATKSTLDVGALKKALMRTLGFERDLILFFSKQQMPATRKHHRAPPRVTMDSSGLDDEEEDIDLTDIKIPPEMLRFRGMVSLGFDAYMYLYTENQARLMDEVFTTLMKEEKWIVEEDARNKILQSATDLIYYFDQRRTKMRNLNQNQAFFDLFRLFQQYLGKYAEALKAKLATGVALANATLNDEKTWCLIVNTAEYCSNMSRLIEETIQKEISEKFRQQIKLQSEMDRFQEVIAAAVNTLIKYLESRMASAFTEMKAVNWDTLESIGDVSRYVTTIGALLNEKVPLYRAWIDPSFFGYFCDSFLGWFIPKYQASIYECKKVSESGAEQLIVDSTQLKLTLERLPVLGKAQNEHAQDRYLKRVRREMEDVEKLVKLLLTPIESLVDTYKSLFPETHSEAGIAKAMQLKGLPYAVQEQTLQTYGSKQNSVVMVGIREKKDSILPDLDIDASAAASKIRQFFKLE
jgi:vacuolar protein sorting-associated protein 53